MSETKLQLVIEDIEARQEELISLTKKLIAYETPAPPARNTAEAQGFVENYLQEMNFAADRWDVYPNDPNVVGTKQGTDSAHFQSLIVNGHMDVAEVRPEENWEYAPFEAVEKDGRLIGRGAADMKGGLAASLFVLRLFHEHGIELPGDLIFQSVIGEEVGEAGTLQCCKKGYTADYAVVVDTSNLHIQGQGGVITGWVTIKDPNTYHDANRRQMIHAGGGMAQGASAIEKMVVMIESLQTLERHWAVSKHYPGYPPGTNTINPAVIEGGRHAAFIADECRLWITVHFYPDESYETVSREIEEHLLHAANADPWLRENPPHFTWGGESMIEERGEVFPAFEVDPLHGGTETLKQSYQEVLKETPVLDVSPTVTDGGWLAEAGIPTALFGPGELSEAHAVNESVAIQELLDFSKVMADFMYHWCHTKK
ncbi:acetylornithine deacetylase [Alkalicoccus daliensis]|uniref:N-formyl-4-amino-5-aminomethyl-2-methylpyrimidine deformylase n=1 Tax=Alkalicoccus daliensis TaxID=745820 RepID=A0A1H0JYN8_9BACI|nr:acetylornithine deacetylase [Alkalicoccus daliensis]SDO48796.1 N-formyl-4-amino-5-aminomethyl-2-methylpyrimidinedeformylase [Alkalicoccus daliensis]